MLTKTSTVSIARNVCMEMLTAYTKQWAFAHILYSEHGHAHQRGRTTVYTRLRSSDALGCLMTRSYDVSTENPVGPPWQQWIIEILRCVSIQAGTRSAGMLITQLSLRWRTPRHKLMQASWEYFKLNFLTEYDCKVGNRCRWRELAGQFRSFLHQPERCFQVGIRNKNTKLLLLLYSINATCNKYHKPALVN